MSNDVRNRLAESLRGQADRIAPGPSLADAAQTQARQIRLRRRVTAGAACLVALAIAIPFGLVGSGISTNGGDDRSPRKIEQQPVDPPKQAQGPQPAPKGDPVVLDPDFDTLPEGDWPGVPRYFDGVIYDGDQQIPVGELPTDAAVNFSPTAYGYLANITDVLCCGGDGFTQYTNRLLPNNSDPIDLQDNVVPVVSANGRTVAKSDPATRERTDKKIAAADAETGEILETSPIVAHSDSVDLLGFVGEQVVFSAEDGARGITAMWDPTTNDITELEGVSYGYDVTASGLLLADLTKSAGEAGGCIGLVDITTGSAEVRWYDCQLGDARFSGDDRFVVDTFRGSVSDLTTGEVLYRVRRSELKVPSEISDFHGDAGGDIVFLTQQPGEDGEPDREGFVRCTTDGECEIAGEVRELGTYPDPGYSLID